MGISIDYFDPNHKSTGVNTVLKIVKIDVNEGKTEIDVPHGLGFVPSWVRVTPLANAIDFNGRVTPTVYDAVCQPIIQAGLITDHPKWDPGKGPVFRDLREVLGFVMQNDAEEAVPAYFLVEIGRTHSVPK